MKTARQKSQSRGVQTLAAIFLLSWWLFFPTHLESVRAADWPQFLGPARNGAVAGEQLAKVWPTEGPLLLWQKKIGQGFSGPVVAQGKLILFHRIGGEETVECLEAATGKPLWQFGYPATYQDDFGFDEGPRAVPAIAGNQVYTFGADGVLHGLDFECGKLKWRVDVRAQFDAPKGFFGLACSPLVEGDLVLLNIGGARGAGIAAFKAGTGELAWQATNEEASYSSPVAATIRGERLALFLARGGLVALNPADGQVRFEFPWRARLHASVNGATPLVFDDLIFISASYQVGAALLRVGEAGLKTVWKSDDALSNHYATSVHRDGFLYGLHGRHDFPGGTELRCIELMTGKVRWSKPGLSPANVILAGDHLLVLTENGQLLRVAAGPEKFQETGRAQILPAGVRAYPAWADGLFFARSKDRLVCLDLRVRKPAP